MSNMRSLLRGDMRCDGAGADLQYEATTDNFERLDIGSAQVPFADLGKLYRNTWWTKMVDKGARPGGCFAKRLCLTWPQDDNRLQG